MMAAVPEPSLADPKMQAEWEEYQAVLQSGILEKSANTKAFLSYVAGKYFTGTQEDVKEYSIAVQALRRPPSFDSQTDTIVRVTAHTLRRRLRLYYESEGADHAVQMQLPPGRYILRFDRKQPVESEPPQLPAEPSLSQSEAVTAQAVPIENSKSRFLTRTLMYGAVVALLCASVFAFLLLRRGTPDAITAKRAIPVAANVLKDSGTQRVTLGESLYSDSSGSVWTPSPECKGGNSYRHADHAIAGTEDQELFQQGRDGVFECVLPESPGIYEVRLFFADTSSEEANVRHAQYTVNGRQTDLIDVADQAGSPDRATAFVLAGVHPAADGAIHIRSNAEAITSAIAISRTPTDEPSTFRMVTGPVAVHDSSGYVWQSDVFFVGGRRVPHPGKSVQTEDARLYSWDRLGHFRYLIPVAKGHSYSLSLYFSEGYFGADEPGHGGKGDRLFDVYCNGTTLLHNFDVYEHAANHAYTQSFRGLRPTADGQLELDFVPGVNYPMLNALKVEAEE